jgi:MFS family permease
MVTGIFLRIFSLALVAFSLFYSANMSRGMLIGMIFFAMTLFSVSGSLANVPYIDILGKSIAREDRKRFFSVKQMINSAGVLISAIAVRHVLRNFDYPVNYSVSFWFASGLLLVASLGFISIREVRSSTPRKRETMGVFLRRVGPELKKYPNLVSYLFILNTTGIAITFVPFMIMLAKDTSGLSSGFVGNLILLKVSGMVLPSLVLYFYHKKYSYKRVLKISVVLGGLLPPLSLLLVHQPALYQYLFVLSGIYLALYRIAINGILIEISNDENRTFFAGITGAGNILASLLPVFSGMFILWFGYTAVFLALALLILSGYYFASRLECSAAEKNN